jgi:hypothetical protein
MLNSIVLGVRVQACGGHILGAGNDVHGARLES